MSQLSSVILHERPSAVTRALVPDGIHLVSGPSRLNLAGFCRECLQGSCRDEAACVAKWGRYIWVVCTICDGVGELNDDGLPLDDPGEFGTTCRNCTDGVMEWMRS